MKILIIDDEEIVRDTLHAMLEFAGHSVIDPADGPTGVARAKEKPDLIFCDVSLPGLDGYQVLQAIQQMPECRDVPFIFVTGWSDRKDQRKGMALAGRFHALLDGEATVCAQIIPPGRVAGSPG